jgi:hypothetical protein
MAAVCEFYHISPADYWSSTVEDIAALGRRMKKRQEEAERENARR